LEIEGRARLVVDTGSSVSIIQPAISLKDVRDSPLKPFGITGEVLEIKGQQRVSFKLGGREFNNTFLVCSLPTQAAGLLGMDFWKRAKARLDFECDMMALSTVIGPPRAYGVMHENRAVLTVFPEGKARRSSPPERREQLLVDKPTSDDSR
jgi:hypothetical protein